MAGNTFDEGDAETAGEDSALTGIAAVAPQVAAAAAAIDKAGDLVDGANDAGKWIGGALDDVFGGGDEHPGQSTFDVDPNAVPESEAEYEEKMARAKEAMDKGGAENHKRVHLWNGKHQDVENAVRDSDAADVRWAARKARAGKVQDAGADVRGGAFDDPRLAEISQSDPHVKIGGDPVVDVDELPTADHTPAEVPFGSDVELNPQPIPPGKASRRVKDVGPRKRE